MIGHIYVKFHALQLLFSTFFNISYRPKFLYAFLKINSIKKKSDRSFLRKILRSTTFVWKIFRYLLSFSRYKLKTAFDGLFGLTGQPCPNVDLAEINNFSKHPIYNLHTKFQSLSIDCMVPGYHGTLDGAPMTTVPIIVHLYCNRL